MGKPVTVIITMDKSYSDWSHWDQGRTAIINKIEAAGWNYKIHTDEE